MSFYYKRLLEDAELTSVQDPDDVGVDLDQVEEDIMGDDGVAAHEDEVEAAVEGEISDPIEEAYVIMYESEYNYNQLLHTIGVHELNETASNRDFILEAVDIKGFFARVKNMFQKMFEGITKAFKTVLTKLDIQAKMDKKFVEKYKKDIALGAEKEWSMQGYVFPATKIQNTAFTSPEILEDVVKDIRAKGNHYNPADEIRDGDRMRGAEIKKATGIVDVDNIADMNKELMNVLRGSEKPVELNGKVTANDVCDILSKDRETRKLRENYNAIKGSYAKAIKCLTSLQKQLGADDENYMAAFSYCEKMISLAKFQKNMQNSIFTCLMRAAKEKRAQARKLAHHFRKNAEKKTEVQHNSASVFGDILFV